MLDLQMPQLFGLSRPQHQPGCPILVQNGLLLQQTDGRLAVQLEMISFAARPVSAVIVSIHMQDVTRRPLGHIESHYLDLNAQPFTPFGDRALIQLNVPITRAFAVGVQNIVYQDGTVWENPSDKPLDPLPEGEPLPFSGKLLQQYHRSTGCSRLTCLPLEQEGLWRCGCGTWNVAAAAACSACACHLSTQKQYASAETLAPLLAQWEEEQAAQRAAAEKAAREKAEAEAERRRVRQRKQKKLLKTLALLLTAALAVYFLVIPAVFNSMGENAFSAGEYADAYSAFAIARNGERAAVSAELAGDQYMDEGQYAKAETAYANAGAYSKQQEAAYFVQASAARLTTDTYATSDGAVFLPQGVALYHSEYGSKFGLVRFGKDGWVTPPVYNTLHCVKGLTDWQADTVDVILAIEGDPDYSGDVTYAINASTGEKTKIGEDIRFGTTSEDMTVFYEDNGLRSNYGFIDRQGRIITSTRYGSAAGFSEGLARVRVGGWATGKWGYIDKTGTLVIPCQYDDAGQMQNGYAVIQKNDKWGMIDKTGATVIAPTWGYLDHSESFVSQGVVRVKTNKQFEDGGYYGLVRISDGKTVLSALWTNMGDKFGDGLLFVRKNYTTLGKTHYPTSSAVFVDANGVMKINLMSLGIDGAYECYDPFENGIAVLTAWVDNGKSTRDLWDCAINTEGKIVIPFSKYDLNHKGTTIVQSERVGSRQNTIRTYYIVDGNVTTTPPANQSK